MSEPVTQSFKVLFVDDEREFLDVAQRAFGNLSHGSWDILTASDAAAALAILQQHTLDLIILDVRMPEIGGLELIGRLQKDYPAIPKVFLAGVVEESDRVAGLESGAALFLEKPTDAAGLQSIYATLNELLKWREKRPAGTVPSAGILDLVKLECSSGNSRLFEVFTEELRGQIFIKEGAIIHAECPGRRGQSAFSYLTTLLEAGFNLRQYTEPVERSVVRQWEFLYLEAVQLREQLVQAAAEAKAKARETATAESIPTPTPEPASPAETPTSPPTPSQAQAPTAAAQPQPSQVTDDEATRQLFRRPAPASAQAPAEAPPAEATSAPSKAAATPVPPPAPPPAPAEAPLQLRMLHADRPTKPSAAPASQAVAPPPLTGDPRIREFLVCSYHAEVLHEWQCPAVEPRLQWVEAARDRSERLTQHLPLGPVDRLEFQAADGRLLIRFQEDGAILMRSTTGEEPGPPGPGQFHQSMGGWLARHAQIRGMLAAGVVRPPQPAVTQTGAGKYRREGLAVAWECVQELFNLAPQQGIDPWQIRWVYEQAQLYGVRRQDAKILVMFLVKDPKALDATAVEKVFREFRSLQAM
jgi:CheY-like chemotaxis protein